MLLFYQQLSYGTYVVILDKYSYQIQELSQKYRILATGKALNITDLSYKQINVSVCCSRKQNPWKKFKLYQTKHSMGEGWMVNAVSMKQLAEMVIMKIKLQLNLKALHSRKFSVPS
jgi:hypothetical protein